MKKTLLTALLLCSSPLAAQTWSGPGEQPVSYPRTGSTFTGVLGDGSDARGGVAPAVDDIAEIADNSFTHSTWYTASGALRTVLTSPSTQQSKVRFNCQAVQGGTFDIILNPGVDNWGHHHTFTGRELDANTDTYAELRAAGTFSRCPGGPLNRTAYWEPSVCKDLAGPGICSALKPKLTAFYYTTDRGTDAEKFQILPPGLAFIGGVNPADPDDLERKAEVPAGFAYSTDGFVGWKCYQSDGSTIVLTDAGTSYSDALETEAGADPWGGRCLDGYQLWMTVNAPPCWDGKNLTSPNGRDHFRYKIRHIDSGVGVCPDGWYEVPVFEAFSVYTHNGPSDYMEWYFSSDRMDPNPANWQRNGFTGHFDWKNGWEPDIIERWLAKCVGVTVDHRPDLTPEPADCNYGTVDAGVRLLSDSVSPDQVNLPGDVVETVDYSDSANSSRFFPLEAGTTGDITVDHTHGN